MIELLVSSVWDIIKELWAAFAAFLGGFTAAGAAAAAAAGDGGDASGVPGDPEPIPPGGNEDDAAYKYEREEWQKREWRRQQQKEYDRRFPRGPEAAHGYRPPASPTPVPLSDVYGRKR